MKMSEAGVLTFQGVSFNYTLRKPEHYRSAMFQYCNRNAFKVADGRIWGIELEHAIECLRKYAQLKLPDIIADQEAMFRALGFNVTWGTNSKAQHVIIIH
jgi:hypothetical protein